MPLVNVMVNGRAYTIACDDGEEDHLRDLAATVDAKAREVLGRRHQTAFDGGAADCR
jgi:cell division protein ZapA